MRRTLLVALSVSWGLFGTACLRASTSDPDASSNGNNNNGNGNDASNGGSNNPTPDAGNGNHTDAGGGGNDAAMSGPPCKNKVTSYGSGHHNAGQNCVSCHGSEFSLAGTLYTAGSGGTTIAGASITVKDASGATFDLVTQANGNFYTTNNVQFPVTVYASECQISQTSQQMTASLQSGDGGCNRSGCHTTAAQGRIHLP